MSRKPDVPCAVCGTLLWGGRGSLPPGERTCRGCKPPAKPKPVYHPRPRRQPRQRYCKACDGALPLRSQALYCSGTCRRPPAQPKTRSTALQWKQCGHCQRWVCKPGRKYCDDYCRTESEQELRGWRNRKCERCGVSVPRKKRRCEGCLKELRRARRPFEPGRGSHRKRAREYGVPYEPVDKRKVFARDRWRCGICGKHVDRRLKYPHLKSASIDHIVPMSLGGGHTYLNTQCAHFICNSMKSHHGTGDQLALIG